MSYFLNINFLDVCIKHFKFSQTFINGIVFYPFRPSIHSTNHLFEYLLCEGSMLGCWVHNDCEVVSNLEELISVTIHFQQWKGVSKVERSTCLLKHYVHKEDCDQISLMLGPQWLLIVLGISFVSPWTPVHFGPC